MGRRGWPSGHRDDMGHTEESDVRNARPLTLELIETRKNRSERYLNVSSKQRGNFPSCFWMVPETMCSLGTVMGTLKMASEAKVWKLQGGQTESGARAPLATRVGNLTRRSGLEETLEPTRDIRDDACARIHRASRTLLSKHPLDCGGQEYGGNSPIQLGNIAGRRSSCSECV